MARLLRESIRQWPQVRIREIKAHDHKGRTCLLLDLEIIDAAALLESWNPGPPRPHPFADLPSAVREALGTIRFQQEGRRLEIQRHVNLAKTFPGARLLPALHSRNHYFRHRLHLPAAPDETNATRRENAGRTLVWEIPMENALREPVRMHAAMTAPLPWLSHAAGIGTLILVTGLLSWRLHTRRIRKLAPRMGGL